MRLHCVGMHVCVCVCDWEVILAVNGHTFLLFCLFVAVELHCVFQRLIFFFF